MVLSKEHPQSILYRSAEPVLTPTLPQERDGTIANVVFPTGIDRRDDLGSPDRFDVYYGMADNRIGVARLDLPDSLAAGRSRRPAGSKGVSDLNRRIQNHKGVIMKPTAEKLNGKPGAKPESKDDLKSLPMAEVEKKLGSSPDGLTQAEAKNG